MKRFSFRAYAPSGELETGSIDAVDEGDAHNQLSARGLIPARIGQEEEALPWWKRDITLRSVRPGNFELARFSELTSTLLFSGMRLQAAMEVAAETFKSEAAKKGIKNVVRDLGAGLPLVDALNKEHRVFPEEFIRFLSLGDSSNALASVLERMAKFYDNRAAAAARIKSALIYPTILILSAFVLFGVLAFWLAPALQPMFVSTGSQPGGVIEFFFYVNEAIRGNIFAVFIACLVALPFVPILIATPKVRTAISTFFTRLPLIKQITTVSELSTGCRSAALLIESGQTLQRALRQVAQHSKPPIADIFARGADAAEHGKSIPNAMSDPIMPAALPHMLRVADSANTWTKTLETASDLLDRDVQTRQERLIALLTPAITLISGGMMAVGMISIVTALMDLNDLVLPQ